MTRVKTISEVCPWMIVHDVDTLTGEQTAYMVRRGLLYCDLPEEHHGDCTVIDGADGFRHHYHDNGRHKFKYAEKAVTE